MSSNFNDILSVLDTINNEVTVSVYVPSLTREVKFKTINTGQQKNILKAAVDNPVFQTRFTIALYNIIQENCIESGVVPLLTTIDAAAIAVQLRVSTAGTGYVLFQNNRKFNINLQDIINKFKVVAVPGTDTITGVPFTIQVGSPLYIEQYNLEKQLREKTANDKQILSAQITETIGDAFVGEVSKFIKDINIFYNNQEQQVGYSNLSFAKRHALLEKMPNSIIQDVLKYMEKYVSIQKDLLTVSGTDVETGEVVSDLTVLVDSTLFIVNQ